jgi:hypothetical protein
VPLRCLAGHEMQTACLCQNSVAALRLAAYIFLVSEGHEVNWGH